MDWRIYYGDGTTYSQADGGLADAPALDVQAIVVPDDEVGRVVLTRHDYYWFESAGRPGPGWWGGDLFGLFDFLMRSGLVKFGRSIPTAQFREVYRRAVEDPGFPRKSAIKEGERRPPDG
jgi:hypothetical protein